MKWNVRLSANDFSAYEFISADGRKFVCKYNRSQGSIRMRYNENHGVFMVNDEQLINRKFLLSNVYGSEIGMVTKNLWHENTGTVSFNNQASKIIYKIDAHSSFIEIIDGETTHTCEIKSLPHPGRETHFMPVVIALAWVQTVKAGLIKVEVAA